MIVVDASIVVEVLLRSDMGVALESLVVEGDDQLHAPHMLDVEVAHALRRCALHGEIDERRGRASLGNLAAMSNRAPTGICRCWNGCGSFATT